MIVVTDDCGVSRAFARMRAFLVAGRAAGDRHLRGDVGVSCLPSAVALLATAGLTLVAWMPIVGLLVVPLQAAAWIVRGLVFQFMNLATLSAYQTQYRRVSRRTRRARARRVIRESPRMTNYSTVFLDWRRVAARRPRSARWAVVLAQANDMISFAPGYPAEDLFPWAAFAEIAAELLDGHGRRGAAVRRDARVSSAARGRPAV